MPFPRFCIGVRVWVIAAPLPMQSPANTPGKEAKGGPSQCSLRLLPPTWRLGWSPGSNLACTDCCSYVENEPADKRPLCPSITLPFKWVKWNLLKYVNCLFLNRAEFTKLWITLQILNIYTTCQDALQERCSLLPSGTQEWKQAGKSPSKKWQISPSYEGKAERNGQKVRPWDECGANWWGKGPDWGSRKSLRGPWENSGCHPESTRNPLWGKELHREMVIPFTCLKSLWDLSDSSTG